MTLTIRDTTMTSDQTAHTAHTARQVPSPQRGWEVTWLPGQILDRNTAITAMTLADLASEPDLDERHRLWPAVQSWSAELGLSGTDAITRAAQPSSAFTRQPEPPGRQTDREAAD